MFDGKRYVTRGVENTIPADVQWLIWNLIDDLVAKREVEPDYLQIFELQPTAGGGQKIVHRQEVPEYLAEYVFDKVNITVSVKLYVIDDGDHCTMILPEER